MSENNQTEQGLAANTQSRRVFMRRAGTGAVIAALPMKSVWANGITNSIIASGHGSDWAGGADLVLRDSNFFTSLYSVSDPGPAFKDIFSGNAIHENGTETLGDDVTFYNILSSKDNSGSVDTKFTGPSLYNQQLVTMYLNALNHGNDGIAYPVVNQSTGRPFSTANQYAQQLYTMTIGTPSASGSALGDLIANPYSFSVSP
jgi:hypothetical protein